MKLTKIIFVIILVAIPLAFFLKGAVERADLSSFDQKRINDLLMFKKGMEKYFEKNGHYPIKDEGGCLEDLKKEFQELVPQYLDFVPQDPRAGLDCYFYQTKNQGEFYKLAALLEVKKTKARQDGGNLKNYFEVFNKKEEQVETFLNYEVLGWGNNEAKQVSFKNEKYKKAPQKILKLSRVVALAASEEGALGLTRQGEVYFWGYFRGETPERPKKILTGIKAIAAGKKHYLVLTEGGKVYAWGKNESGQLGDGTLSPKITPLEVKNLPEIKSISAGAFYSLALTSDGFIYTWGDNAHGQIGDGVPSPRKLTPVKVVGITNAQKIAAGFGHSLAMTDDDKVYSWGYNRFGQLGLGDNKDRNKPVEIKNLKNIEEVAAGDNHSLVLTQAGLLFVWGAGQHGELGDVLGKDRNSPFLLEDLPLIKSLAAGAHHSLALTRSGEVYSWGYNFFGQLGDLSIHDRFSPVKVLKNKFLNFLIKEPLDNIMAISAGNDFSLAIRKGD